MCEYAYYKWVDSCDNCEVLSDIVEHRKKYKRLIREALEAWDTEEAAAYGRGYKDGIYDN